MKVQGRWVALLAPMSRLALGEIKHQADLPIALRKLWSGERLPMIVEGAFNPKHTELTPNALNRIETLFDKGYGQNKSMEPNRPFYYFNSTTPFFMCNAPKTGCTTWGVLQHYVNSNVSVFDDPERIYTRPFASKSDKWNSYNRNLFDELKKRDRIWIARNPFVRFVSSYLDWLHRNSIAASDVNFETFISLVEAYVRGNNTAFVGRKFLPSHVLTITSVCKSQVFGTDIVLRLEEMELWYDTFMHHYGLDVFEAKLQAEHGQNFYKPDLGNATLLSERFAEAIGLKAWRGSTLKTSHIHNSTDVLREHYTPDLARRVFNLQRKDFEAFGYPAWGGDNELRLLRERETAAFSDGPEKLRQKLRFMGRS